MALGNDTGELGDLFLIIRGLIQQPAGEIAQLRFIHPLD
jgi:hypothetical protein